MQTTYQNIPALAESSSREIKQPLWHRGITRVVKLGVICVMIIGLTPLSFAAPEICDADANGIIDCNDIQDIFAARNTPVTEPDDPRDADLDGIITVNDARICSLAQAGQKCSDLSFPIISAAKYGECIAAGAACQEPVAGLRGQVSDEWKKRCLEDVCKKHGKCEQGQTCTRKSDPAKTDFYPLDNDNKCADPTKPKGCYVAAFGQCQCKCE